ncbi:MAG: cobalt ECF transporter T component CbiQ [Candidatus Competibacteraceae bacterium]|nr:cobalt ECF transporter T component CbiQ [Candidatus Competibacteraceae bacterium]
MRAIDHHAWTNRWRDWHPVEKGLPAIGLLTLTLILPPLTTAPLVLAGVMLTTVYGAGIPWKTLLSVLAAPATFLLAGIPFLAISIDFTSGFALTFSPEGFQLALQTMIRALAAMSCLAFLILTMPLTDGVLLLRRMGVPAGIIELILLIYRLIFVFAERALTGRQAQAGRLGYSRLDRSVRSLGLLGGNLFQRALEQARRLEMGLMARGYTGELRVLTPRWKLSWMRLAVGVAGVSLTGLASSWLARGLL